MSTTTRHVVLVGLMGAGKTAVGRALADRLGMGFVDTDDLVTARAGVSIPEIFAAESESGFRALERMAVSEAASSEPSVIACGGGVPLDGANRKVLRRSGTVVWLRAAPEVLASRVGVDGSRPLLEGSDDLVGDLERLAVERADVYSRVSHVALDATGSVESVVEAVLAAVAPHLERIEVAVEPRPYEVLVGPDAVAYASVLLGDRRRVAIITQDRLRDHADRLEAVLRDVGCEVARMAMGEGEQAKSLGTVERLADDLSRWGLARDDAVVALGGGVVGDTAGFTAAAYHRGVDVVQVPTTLLAMVDASIGGKTAVNLPAGKNLVGAFHQPLAVLCDPSTLATLSDPEFRSGLGEVAKYALMGERPLAELILAESDAIRARDPVVLSRIVSLCAAVKARVVSDDPLERRGERVKLNYGHTLAHALETVGSYDLRHGEAVAIGLMFAAHLAVALERVPRRTVDEHRALLDSLGLATVAPGGLDPADLVAVMRRDKKATSGLNFVLAGAPGGGVELVQDPDERGIRVAFEAIGVPG